MDNVPIPRATRLWNRTDFFRPFRASAGSEAAGENIIPLYDPSLHRHAATTEEEPDLRDLNAALSALVDVFPDLEPEVFREMLMAVSDESRAEVVTEQLLKKNAKYVRGRWRTSRKLRKAEKKDHERAGSSRQAPLTTEDTFRSDSYKQAVKQVFYQEFRNLSHSTIKAVMAEQNFSYTLCRPVLQQLASKSWRFSLASIWSKRSASQAPLEHPAVVQTGATVSGPVLGIKRTGSAQLDHELYEMFVEPIMQKQRRELQIADHNLAAQLNEAEAKTAEALFDCECCYGSVTFEQLAVCDDGCHQLCFDCINRSVCEALYGQGWSRIVDLEKSTVRCFAPSTQECGGSLGVNTVRRALAGPGGDEDTWHELQARMASEALIKSGLRLQRCPFCSYAEVDEVPPLVLRSTKDMWKHIATKASVPLQITLLSLTAGLVFFTVPITLLVGMLWMLVRVVPPVGAVIDRSWTRVYKQRRGLKFKCLSPACGKISCISCTAKWRDPHVCFETEKTSLRTAIESSATAAVKRTCPRCLLSFVKSSGCNKLVCNCGYTMCYICRQEITSKEGYSHFCQHFRPSGGRCSECERCDLYGDEDEEAAIRKAAEAAEKAWREQEGGKDGDEGATKLMVDALVGQAKRTRWHERCLDALIDIVAS